MKILLSCLKVYKLLTNSIKSEIQIQHPSLQRLNFDSLLIVNCKKGYDSVALFSGILAFWSKTKGGREQIMTILEMTEFVFITFFQLGKTVMAFTSLNTASRYVGSVSDLIDTNFPYPSFSSASSEKT